MHPLGWRQGWIRWSDATRACGGIMVLCRPPYAGPLPRYVSLPLLTAPLWAPPQPHRRLLAGDEGHHRSWTVFCRSPSVIPAHTPGAHGAPRATDLYVSLVVHSALSQSCLFEAKSANRISENQWFARLNFPVFGNLRQSPRSCRWARRASAASGATNGSAAHRHEPEPARTALGTVG